MHAITPRLARATLIALAFGIVTLTISVSAHPGPPKKKRGKRWAEMDYGPYMTASIEAPRPKRNIAYKGIAIRLGGEEWEANPATVIFDTDLLRYSAGWTGGFVDWRNIAFDGSHNTHMKIVGDQVFGNAQIPGWHPCQTLADLMTIKEKKRKLKGLKIAWIGDGNNVCNSLIFGCSRSEINISIATPKGYEPDKKVVENSKKYTDVEIIRNPIDAVKDADVVMTDTFTSIHDRDTKRIKNFLPKYQVNPSLMKKAKKDVIFLHCLPAKRGNEVTSSVIDGKQSVVWEETENRLHTQKALLASLSI